MPIQVLVVDDHQLVRQGLRALLEREGFKVVGEAANGQEAIQLAETLHPEVVVMDLAMPVLNGIDATREIQRVSPKTKTILLTMHTDHQYILEGLRGGAKGYVMKTHAANDLVRAIREAARGGTYYDPLSARERQVLQLIAEGKSTKECAVTLDISVKTAETYRSRIMEKLDIHETASMVRYAIRRGLVQP
jgi:DNA-binding NarL/FixJ family response regulator